MCVSCRLSSSEDKDSHQLQSVLPIKVRKHAKRWSGYAEKLILLSSRIARRVKRTVAYHETFGNSSQGWFCRELTMQSEFRVMSKFSRICPKSGQIQEIFKYAYKHAYRGQGKLLTDKHTPWVMANNLLFKIACFKRERTIFERRTLTWTDFIQRERPI